MEANILNTIGLVLSILGGSLWFFYSFPQPTHEEGIGLALEDGTVLPDGRTAQRGHSEGERQALVHIEDGARADHSRFHMPAFSCMDMSVDVMWPNYGLQRPAASRYCRNHRTSWPRLLSLDR
jgi:hypothetical protein